MGRDGGELNDGEGVEVEGGVLVGVHHREVGGLEVPLVGDVTFLEVSGPLEEEGMGVAV
jgi:hypothetical protein